MQLLLVSDIHMDLDRLGQLITQAGTGVDAVICAGDLTNYGNRSETQQVTDRLCATPLLAIPGNLDTKEGLQWLEEEGYSIHAQQRTLRDWSFVGFGGGSPEFVGEILFTDAELGAAVDPLLRTTPPQTTVLVTHQPPFDTTIDRVHGITHRGSRAVRQLIERYQPAYQICGHIHESWGEDRIGTTRCLNVAAVKEGRAALLDLTTGHVTRLHL